MWTSYKWNYKKQLEEREGKRVDTFKDYTVQTRKLIKDMIYSLVTNEENFESKKFKMTGGLVSVSNEIFDFMDKNKDSFVS